MDENKLRKIFIIGNGFDLNLGYPTRFKDFVDFCINWESFYKKEVPDKYAKGDSESNIDNYKLSYKDEKQINHWYEINKLKICVDKDEQNELNDLDKLIKNNGFIKYLKENKDTIKYERWSDFENHLLELCEMCDEHENQILLYGENIDKNERLKLNDEFNNFLRYVYVENNYYSTSIPTDKFIVQTLVKIDKQKFIEHMSKELQGFNKAFNIYLKCFVNKIESPQWNLNFDDNTMVIDFNYTNFAIGIFKNAKINYVHGHQHDNNIIIGINSDKLNREYDLLTKKYLRLKLDVWNTQVNEMSTYGKYDSIEDFKSLRTNSRGVRRIIPAYVVVIGQSLNKVDWDILIEYFSDEKEYKKVIICYHNSYDNQLFNLHQMLENYNIDYKIIDKRIKTGYYTFIKFDKLKDLLCNLDKDIENLSIHKYDDLDEKEEKILKEIVKYQNDLVSGGKYITSAEDIDEDEMGDILENLSKKGYITIKEGPKTLSGPNRPYIITKILKY